MLHNISKGISLITERGVGVEAAPALQPQVLYISQ